MTEMPMGSFSVYFVEGYVPSGVTHSLSITDGTQSASYTGLCDAADCCSIACPTDQEFTLAGGQCEVIANYVINTVGDCDIATALAADADDNAAAGPVTGTVYAGVTNIGDCSATPVPFDEECITVPADPVCTDHLLTYSWTYETNDGTFWDEFQVELNGTQIDGSSVNTFGPTTEMGANVLPVVPGDVLCFQVETDGVPNEESCAFVDYALDAVCPAVPVLVAVTCL